MNRNSGKYCIKGRARRVVFALQYYLDDRLFGRVAVCAVDLLARSALPRRSWTTLWDLPANRRRGFARCPAGVDPCSLGRRGSRRGSARARAQDERPRAKSFAIHVHRHGPSDRGANGRRRRGDFSALRFFLDGPPCVDKNSSGAAGVHRNRDLAQSLA